MNLLQENHNEELKDSRISRIIFDYERQSEILVGWAQLIVITIIATTYMLSPIEVKNDYKVYYDPIPWIMGFYITFTIIRLIKAYRGYLVPWFIGLSIIIDITALTIGIWGIHNQFDFEFSYALKTGSVIYYFIFIALRTLCFQSKWVMLAGVTSMIAWAYLVVYALAQDGTETTTSVLDYFNSPNVILSAEVEKILIIFIITVILSIGLKRSRSLLIQSIKRQISNADFSRFFSPQVAQKITSSSEALKPGEGHVSQAAILFLDLRNFSKYIHLMDPDEALQLIQEYQIKFVPIIQKHHGCIDKFLGDGILASFGAVSHSDTYAADALRAMQDILCTFEKWKNEAHLDEKFPPLNISMAMAVGPVVFGITGVQSRLEYTIIGDTVNLAAKLEKQTRIENVEALTTQKSFERAIKQGYNPNKEFKKLENRDITAIDETINLIIVE